MSSLQHIMNNNTKSSCGGGGWLVDRPNLLISIFELIKNRLGYAVVDLADGFGWVASCAAV